MAVETLILGGILVVGIVLLVFGGRKLRTLLRLRADDPVSIGDAPYADNPVEVEGRVETIVGEEPLNSPLMDRDCIVYDYKIEEKRRSSNNSKSSSWRTVESGEEYQSFILADDSGRALVVPDTATLSLEGEREHDSLFSEYLPGNVSIGRGLSIGGLSLGGRQKRYTEERLDVGKTAYVYGEASSNTGDVDAAVTLSDGDETPKFLLSDASAAGTQQRYLLNVGGLGLLGTAITVTSGAMALGAL